MKSVKILVLVTISTCCNLITHSQLKLSGNPIQGDMEKVVKDYPNQFKNIVAEEISKNPQSTDYRSAIKLAGAEECTVTKYSAKNKEVYSWQASMLTTDDFETAKKKFKTLYTQLNNLTVRFAPNETFHFKGNYEIPVEEKKFTSSIFSADPANETIKGLKIELTMEYELLDWKIKILVYNRERDDNESGELKEN